MFASIKKGIVRFFQINGYTLAPDWKIQQLGMAKHLSKLFNVCEIDCVLDVGANIGQYRDFLRNEVGFKGHIYSFEPISQNVERLRRLSQNDPKWHIKECALGSTPGEMFLNVMADTALSSFRVPTTSKSGAHLKDNVVKRVEKVQVETLNRILPEIQKLTNVSRLYLKMDTQGFDLEVVKGALNVLKDVIFVQTEASIIPIYDGMPDYKLVITELEKLGYVINGMFPVTPLGSLRLAEFDCIMFRKDFLENNLLRN